LGPNHQAYATRVAELLGLLDSYAEGAEKGEKAFRATWSANEEQGQEETVCALTCTEKGISQTSDDVVTWAPPCVEGSPPAKWDNATLAKWVGELEDGKFLVALKKLPKSMTGALFLRSSVPGLTHQLFEGDKALAQELHTAFKTAMKSFREAEAARQQEMEGAGGAVPNGSTSVSSSGSTSGSTSEGFYREGFHLDNVTVHSPTGLLLIQGELTAPSVASVVL
jgi:hypothetical protein